MTVTSEAFWNKIAQRYSKQTIGDMANYEKKLAATQALMTPNMKVLEFGCGTGSTALLHAPHVAQIDATDLSSSMITIGREKAKAADIQNVNFLQASIESFQGQSEGYDMILALNLLHLIPDRNLALSKIYSLLKPGGLFISSTACLSDKMWFLRPLIPVMQWLGKAPYVQFFGEKTMTNDVLSTGFTIQEKWGHGQGNSVFIVAKKS